MTRTLSILVIFSWGSVVLAASDRMSTADGQAHNHCQRKCQAAAKRFYRECLQDGGTDPDCKDGARRWFQQCVEENCTPALPCEIRCENRAKHLYRECVEAGENMDVCATRARAALVECLTEHCSMPDGCEKRCEYLGHHLARMCVSEGGNPDDCRARAQEFVQQCIHEQCAPCGGIAGVECPKDQFCLFPQGECDVADNQGKCVTVPEACPLVYRPVCGCDRKTYENACEAAASQVSIDHEGPCSVVCGGIAGLPCPEGNFCQFAAGRCNVSDDQGHCRPIPQTCPDVWMPVCGCDGVTYRNECEAAMTQMSISHFGPCGQVCEGVDDPACPGTHYCYRQDGGCPSANAPGICRIRPSPEIECGPPVCGCNGKSYRNLCVAAADGTSAAFVGLCRDYECYEAAGSKACPEGKFCTMPPSQCNVHDNIGVCVEIPSDCSGDTSIVCGCDGQTYSLCQARMAQVSIDHPGFCEPQSCGGDTGPQHPGCRTGSFCDASIGCDILGGGVCKVIPTQCPDVWMPVCGCDGVTYGNACDAAANEVTIDYEGECVR